MSKEKSRSIKLVITFIILLIVTAFTVWALYFSGDFFKRKSILSNNEEITRISKDIEIELTQEEFDGVYNDYKARVNLNDLSIIGRGAHEERSVITIDKGGVYYFYGENENANIIIDAKEESVVLVFDRVKLTSINTAVINCVSAKNVVINIPEGTRTELDDGNNYSEFTGEGEPNSLVYSKADIIINGKGSLRLKANYKDGLSSKGNIIVLNDALSVNAKENAVIANSVFLNDTRVNINSIKNGIESTGEDGFVFIAKGSTNITSYGYGINAKSTININDNSDIVIAAEGEGTDLCAIKSDKEITINSGKININSKSNGIHSEGYIIINDIDISLSANGKGFYSKDSFIINNGKFDISSLNTGVETNYLEVNDGSINIKADKSGIYSAGAIQIKGGDIEIAGPTDNQNGAIDYKRSFDIDGGEVLYYGAVGMWKDSSLSSSINTASFIVFANRDDVISIKDENGDELAHASLIKDIQRISFASSKLQMGKTYFLFVNDEEKSKLTVTSVVTIDQITGNY